MRDGCAHRILSVHLDPLPSAAVTTSGMHLSPRALSLAASIGWRHVTADPVRALLLAWRVLPAPLRGSLSLAGPYGRAAMLWGEGDRPAALAVLAGSPRRQAVFALAADQPATAAAALERLPDTDPARPVLAARLAWREGRLTDALHALDSARNRQARRLRATLTGQRDFLAAGQPLPAARQPLPAAPPTAHSMIAGSSGRLSTATARDHEPERAGKPGGVVGRAPREGEPEAKRVAPGGE